MEPPKSRISMAFPADISFVTLKESARDVSTRTKMELAVFFRYLHLQQAPRPFFKVFALLDTSL
jgi:hypothetical protein